MKQMIKAVLALGFCVTFSGILPAAAQKGLYEAKSEFTVATSATLSLCAGATGVEGLAPRDVAPDGVFKDGSLVLFIGDSITHGGRLRDMNHYLGHGYQAEIAARYLGYRPDKGLCFMNRAVSGDTTEKLLKRWDKDVFNLKFEEVGWRSPFPERTGTLKPDVVSLLVGINDFHRAKKGRDGMTLEKYATNLETLVSTTLKRLPGVKMVICEPFSLYEPDIAALAPWRNAARDVAERHKLCFVDFQKFYSETLLKENPRPGYWFWDSAHPTYAAHIRMADYWIKKVLEFPPVEMTTGKYPYAPVALNDVKVTGGFWLPRIETNRLVTVRTDFAKCEETGRIANFEKAGRREKGGFKGVPWDDSDVYKVIEGAAYTLAQHHDAELDRYLDGLIAKIASAQESDGYLYTARTLGHKAAMMGPKPFSRNRDACELYNVGHLYEAAVAHYEVTGKRALLDVAIKNADLVAKTFGLGEGQSRETSGHEEIEIGLCRLYQATGDKKYLKLAQHFIDMRGRKDLRPIWGAAYQDHVPVLMQKEALGHAVRAAYLYSGMADVAALAGNASYVKAIDGLWENVVGRKLHLSGGIGVRRSVKYSNPAFGSAHEAFGDDYDLQNLDCYLETCAAIGNALWNERMFLLHGDAKYIDVMERTLYNGLISGVSIGGDEFFYPNPLATKGGYKRSKWFSCSCCPVNVVRFIPQIGRFAYATKDNAAYVNLFMESEATLKLASGDMKLSQKTEYPWKGSVRIEVTPGRAGSPLPAVAVAGRPPYQRFALNIRVPGWCVGKPVPGDLYSQVVAGTLDDFSVKVNGAPVKVLPVKGYCVIDREWKAGDVVEIAMNMPVRRIKANDKVWLDRGYSAVERGPLVYCAEGADNGGKAFFTVLPVGATFTEGEIEIASTKMVSLKGGGLTLIPYFAWCHRGAGEMQTWFAEREDLLHK